jgi:hypothetical protein
VKLGRRLRLGSAHAGADAGGGSGPRAGRAGRAVGYGKKWPEKKRNSFPFSFSNFSKQIFKRFSNPNLNLIKLLISKI